MRTTMLVVMSGIECYDKCYDVICITCVTYDVSHNIDRDACYNVSETQRSDSELRRMLRVRIICVAMTLLRCFLRFVQTMCASNKFKRATMSARMSATMCTSYDASFDACYDASYE